MSLFELNEYIRRVLALNFQQTLWVAAEIAQCGVSRGHFYLTLIQKNEGEEIMAQTEAVLWAADHRRIRAALGPVADQILQPGLQVRLLVRVDFHERFGLKLHITDLDPAYTYGQMELQRRQDLNTLRQEGLIGKNAAMQLPLVLQRLAVISSEEAAGFQDFKQHLLGNLFEYKIDFQLFATAMQGKNAVPEILEALQIILQQKERYDAIVLIRGGGARLDLAAFDDLALCRAFAAAQLPVLSGIGHETDQSLLDLVVHRALKTPTAVADFILQHNLFFEQELLRSAQIAQALATDIFQEKNVALAQQSHLLQRFAQQHIQYNMLKINFLAENILPNGLRLVHQHHDKLNAAASLCAVMHPDAVLKRGYTLTLQNGKVVTRATDLIQGEKHSIRWHDGEVDMP